MKNMNKILHACVTVLVCGLLSAPVMADTQTLTVSASVTGVCKFTSATSTLSFGALDPSLSSNASATGITTFWCTKGATYNIAGDNGQNYSGSSRQMKITGGGTDVIPYSLTISPTSGSGAGPGSPANLSFSGSIQNSNYVNATAGSYSDTVLVTVTP